MELQKLTEHFFSRSSLDEVSIDELNEFIAEHPYSAVGHYFLAKKIAEPVHAGTERAALFFDNTLWFTENTVNGSFESKLVFHVPDEAAATKSDEVDQPLIDDLPIAEPRTETALIDEPLLEDQQEGIAPEQVGEDSGTAILTDSDIQIGEDFGNSPDEDFDKQVLGNAETAEGEDSDTALLHDADIQVGEDSGTPVEVENFFVEEQVGAEQQPTVGEHGTVAVDEPVAEETQFSVQSETAQPAVQSPALEQYAAGSWKDNGPLPVEQDPSSAIPQNAKDDTPLEQKVEAELPPLQFQSYHTIDYFASQGIRLQQKEMGNDRFGQQLKSFTDWLKSMKKLPQVASDNAGDAGENDRERSVVHIAQDSIKEKEVVTETMAEVWLKQGNKAKAIEVYHKLSLHDPSKSAYFAAKIEQIKS
jgi:hypothetical protein